MANGWDPVNHSVHTVLMCEYSRYKRAHKGVAAMTHAFLAYEPGNRGRHVLTGAWTGRPCHLVAPLMCAACEPQLPLGFPPARATKELTARRGSARGASPPKNRAHNPCLPALPFPPPGRSPTWPAGGGPPSIVTPASGRLGKLTPAPRPGSAATGQEGARGGQFRALELAPQAARAAAPDNARAAAQPARALARASPLADRCPQARAERPERERERERAEAKACACGLAGSLPPTTLQGPARGAARVYADRRRWHA
eukprot:scaffold4120_cov400-Prasinococcus_capsulatus_cf.AAC.25